MPAYAESYRVPNYNSVEAAFYLRLKQGDVRRWVDEELICAPAGGISFLNLLELHEALCAKHQLPFFAAITRSGEVCLREKLGI
jgi:hypothetical protein